MQIRVFLAALLGLAILAPAGSSATARDTRFPQLLAQASQTDEEKAKEEKEEEEKRQKSRRPGRDDAKGKGAAKSAPESAPEKSKDAVAPAKGGEPKQQTKDEPRPQRDQDRARGGDKAKQDATQRTPDETKSKPAAEEPKAAAEEKAKQAPTQRTQDPARRAPEPTQAQEPERKLEPAQRTQEPTQRTQEPAQRQETQDSDRRRPSGDRARRGDDEQRSRERAKQREMEKTSAQELSKTQVRDDKPMTIDGGSRTLQRDGNRVVIRSNDSDRLRGSRGDQRVERLPNGQTRTIVIYPDGTQIITVMGPRGEIIQRSRRDRGGREIILIRQASRAPVAQLNLGPIRITIPREQYIVDTRRASRRELHAALFAPPVEPVERIYSLEEVRRFDRVRDKMRRIDINTITFDTDSALITPDQARTLEELADIINELIGRNPGELFMLEGHTDLVGSEIYNLALSDRRAESVAIALTDYFDVPPENLVTQGYGEAYPKIPTEAAERENRRVAVRRLTPLVTGKN